MTPEQRARHVLRPESACGATARRLLSPPCIEDLEQAITAAILEAEKAAVIATRQACARAAHVAARRWPENPLVRATLKSFGDEIDTHG
jgi:hypothetical protein